MEVSKHIKKTCITKFFVLTSLLVMVYIVYLVILSLDFTFSSLQMMPEKTIKIPLALISGYPSYGQR